jgi:putative transposase
MLPRRVVPGRVCFVTRRCTQRQFLLRPDAKINQAIEYCFGEAVNRFGLIPLCFEAMSNHVHFVVFDPHGVLPAFMAHFHRMVAKVVNCRLGRWENLWSNEQPNVVECIQPEDGFGKMIYSLTNPLQNHLVERAHHWPGVSSLRAQLSDKPVRVRRPHWYFDKEGKMPLYVEFRYGRIPGFEHLSHEEWAEKIRAAIAAEEEKAAEERRKTRIPILGVHAIKDQSPYETPATSEDRFGITPRVAAKSKWARIEALQRHKRFVAAYREAFEARRRGDLDVVFPYGTYHLCVLGLVRVEPPPA